MASEVPVIASRAGGLPEVVEDGGCGYLLRVGDVDAMSAKAIEILTNDALQQRMGRRGREIAERKFDVANIVPVYRGFYERVIAGAVTAPS